jgi:ATP-dependent DNA helicase RecQ
MEAELTEHIRAVLAEGPATVERLAASLARTVPAAAARGVRWLERELLLAGFARRLPDGRWELHQEPAEGANLEPTDAVPDLQLPLVERISEWVVFDLETNADVANAAEHEIIEIGACRVRDGEIVEEFDRLVLSARPVSSQVVGLTGIDDEILRRLGAPATEALAGFLAFVGESALIAHNGFAYDFVVLDAACARADLQPAPGTRLDSLELAHVVFPRAGEEIAADVDGGRPPTSRSLEALGDLLGVPRDGRPHRALSDARQTVGIVDEMRSSLDRETPRSRLQRWVLAHGANPWTSLLAPADDKPPLVDVIPEPDHHDPVPATGVFSDVEAVAPLAAGGALMTAGKTARPQQIKMARRIVRAFDAREQVIIEAPTGTGKTLAYLTPSVAWARASGGCVVVATHSKVLQNQILSTIPALEPAFGSVSAALIKGRENYLSLEALDNELDGPPRDPDEALALAVVVGWAAVTPTGDWDDLNAWYVERSSPALTRLRSLLCVEEDESVARTPLQRRCFHRRALAAFDRVDLAVMNHAVLVRRRDWLEDGHALVLDEAHNLEEAATGALTEEVTAASLRTLLDGVYRRRTRWGFLGRYLDATGRTIRNPDLAAVRDAHNRCSDAVELFGTVLTEYVTARAGARRSQIEQYGASYRLRRGLDTRDPRYASVRAASARVASTLREVRDALDQISVPSEPSGRYRRTRLEAEKGRLARRAAEAAKLVYEISNCQSEPEGAWIEIADLALEQGTWSWGLRRAPLSVAEPLREVWNNAASLVLTSATLTIAGSFTHLAARLGIAASPYRLPSPFPELASQHLLVLPDHLPTPRGGMLDEFTQAEADEVARLLLLSGGRALVLMTSRSRLERVRDHARPQLDRHQIPLLAQGEERSPALVDRMRNDERASLLALRSFWEGIDVPGSALSLLVIEKLPFDPPEDPIVAARMDDVVNRGGDPYSDYLVPQAALRFVQGIGRLIRSEQDIGATVVLDKRLRRPTPYREQFLGSVPGPPTILRPRERDQGYEAIAEHLRIDFDDDLRTQLAQIESADVWGSIAELTPEEAQDPSAVKAKLEEVREKLGFAEWRPGQVEIMERLLAGEDVLAVMPTGSGKSVTFQVPALVGPGLTLVISPLIALMRDQIENLRERGVMRVAGIYSGMSQGEQEDVLAGARSGRYKLVYVSPERLWAGRFREALRGVHVTRVAVDEAHCISQWGHSFRPEYAAIPAALAQIAKTHRPTLLAATATATERVRAEIVELLGLDLRSEPVLRSPDRPELRYFVETCTDREERDLRVLEIAEGLAGQAIVVYVPRQKDTVRLAGLLRSANHVAMAYHGGMESEERLNVEEAFRHGDLDVVVATKAFGLGIDKPDIAAVVHIEMPASVEEYVQETGRAARGAADDVGPEIGYCVLIRAPRDCGIHQVFIRHSAPDTDIVRRIWNEIAGTGLTLLPVEELAARVSPDEPEEASNAVGLALHYLSEAGVLRRHGDVMWRGRVWLPPDTDLVLAQLEEHDMSLARRGRELVGRIRALGTEEFDAMGWSRRLGLEPWDLENELLELNRQDVIGLAAWQFGIRIERTGDAEPAWAKIQLRADSRRTVVAELSKRAKEYARQDTTCRRQWLLRYLGLGDGGRCGACDVCEPSLERPWRSASLRREDVVATLPRAAIVCGLLHELDGARFSRRSIEMALLGQEGRTHRISSHLVHHRLFGALGAAGREAVAATIDELIADGRVAEVEVAHNGRAYTTLVLTDAGRSLR